MDDFRPNRFKQTCLAFFTLFTLALSAPFASESEAGLKIMNFNVMCKMCKKRKEYGKFKERFDNIADTVRRHDPDLISFQEWGTKSQIKKMGKALGNRYEIFFSKGLLSWPDPALFVKKERFTAANADGGWLGKRFPKFSFGWKFAIPRRMQWVTVREKASGQEFLFVGTHFDNHGPNKLESSKIASDLFKDSKIPVLFAGDSNLNPSMEGYANLKRYGMEDSFETVGQTTFVVNRPTYDPNDGCGDEKGAVFPDCRIDHVMTSPSFPWKAKSWAVDLFKYTKWDWWVSDHRAVIVNYE